MKTTYVQDKETGKFVEKEKAPENSRYAVIHGDIEAFISPIDKTVISDRRQLREHNKKHGVTDSRDYSQDFMMKRSHERTAEMTGKNPRAKAERIAIINQELRKHGI